MQTSYLFYIGFIVAASVEIYFFLMQRVPLSVGREHDIDSRICRFMLPNWYSAVWLAKIGKWVFIVLIWHNHGWIPAILCVVIPFLLSSVLPIPFTHFSNMMERRLKHELIGPNNEIAQLLLEALKDCRVRHGF